MLQFVAPIGELCINYRVLSKGVEFELFDGVVIFSPSLFIHKKIWQVVNNIIFMNKYFIPLSITPDDEFNAKLCLLNIDVTCDVVNGSATSSIPAADCFQEISSSLHLVHQEKTVTDRANLVVTSCWYNYID